MGISRYFYLLAVASTVLIGCTSRTEKHTSLYPYGIVPLHTPEEYEQSVSTHPDFELVNLKSVLAHANFDIRYATPNNFTSERIYPRAMAFASAPVARALQSVEDTLEELGLALIVFDAYRPYSATMKFYEVYKDTNYVASPYSGSRHNRGCAVDVSLATLDDGTPLKMPTEYDDFSERAHPYQELDDSLAMYNRALLQDVMVANGFEVYPYEWWHFDYAGWEIFPIMDFSFEQISRSSN